MIDKVWLDDECQCVTIDPLSGLVRIDGLPVFKIIQVAGKLHIQFKDSDKLRSKYRGTSLLELPLETLVEKIIKNTF